MRTAVGSDYPLGIKMNTADYLPGGHWYAETSRIARLLADAGVDLIEMSGGMGFMIELRQALLQRAGEREYYFWEAIEPFRRALEGSGVALAAVGGIRTPAVMAGLREQGVDFISMARPWLCEPDLARRIAAGDAPHREMRLGLAALQPLPLEARERLGAVRTLLPRRLPDDLPHRPGQPGHARSRRGRRPGWCAGGHQGRQPTCELDRARLSRAV